MGKYEIIEVILKKMRESLEKSLSDGFNLYSAEKISVEQNLHSKKHNIVFEIVVD